MAHGRTETLVEQVGNASLGDNRVLGLRRARFPPSANAARQRRLTGHQAGSPFHAKRQRVDDVPAGTSPASTSRPLRKSAATHARPAAPQILKAFIAVVRARSLMIPRRPSNSTSGARFF